MPAKGKHRRPKSQRITRKLAVAGTGGAALALPLMAATGAHATTASHPADGKKAAAATYTVKPHDTLAKIAHKKHVRGGWKHLYHLNRKVVGSDPDLIHPGEKLVLGAKHTAGAAKAKASPSSAAQSSAAKGTDTAAQTSGSGYTLPVDGATLGTPWHQAGSMWSSGYHTGQDFIVPTGTPVHAVADGTVVTAGWGGAYGNQVVIQHSDGKYSQYAHMSALKVTAGQTVKEGQEIGVSGATGNVTGPHVHFEIRTTPDYGSDIDPVAYLRSHGVNV
ncbi:LysM peptidoglycan-binding domain-containing M23 family metallopeptidase [Streptomyces sp. TS71-3]|uniref:M23 family metallopeptidase n=1 Tax=Streptomyces sp. TS71-3 TaxID=2733862 RepID=UPI001B04E259|nr:LysM peptidoglycan-binding domain-containing M23 family metallopeptidase [Streptomyces sp. TS71-3]GHJ41870.1 peptidase [Streptomyces sp. TS71-3]